MTATVRIQAGNRHAAEICGGAWSWITARRWLSADSCAPRPRRRRPSRRRRFRRCRRLAIPSVPRFASCARAGIGPRIPHRRTGEAELLVHEGDAVQAGQALIGLDAPQLELGVEAAEQG